MTFPVAIDQLVTMIVAAATVFVLAWKKFQDMKLPDMKKEQGDILQHIRGEKNDALRQRDESLAINDQLRKINQDLDKKVVALHHEVEAMKNKLVLLAELNTRLATTLDTTRARLEEFLRSTPRYELTESPSASAGDRASEAFLEVPSVHRHKDFEEE